MTLLRISQYVVCMTTTFTLTHNVTFLFLSTHPAAQSDISNMSAERFRIFRAEKTYSVNAGKWYFELEVRADVMMVVP